MGSITDKANYLKETKRQIKTAIQDKGVEVSDTDTFRSYAAKINAIQATGGGDTLPIGSMVPYGNVNPPTGWLVCDGSAVSRTSYADLFAVIGTKYGEGDGSTTFNLPNLKGRVPVGLDSDDTDFNSIGKTGGEKKHKLTTEELASHNHIVKVNDNAARDTVIGVTVPYSYGGENRDTSKTGGDQPHNNLQPYEVNNFIIKAFQSAGVVAEVVNTQTESDTNTYSCNYINGIIESGSNSNGNWIKFNDGTMITYQEIEVEIACNTAWGNLFVGNYATAINFPQTFKELPKVLIDLKLKAGACFKLEWEIPIITTSSYKNIGIGRGTTSDAVGLTITLYAIGKWK